MSQNAKPEAGVFEFQDWLTLIPVVHGSAPFAVALRRRMLELEFDVLALPLPPSFGPPVVDAVARLPTVSAVVQVHERKETLASDDDEDFDHEAFLDDEDEHEEENRSGRRLRPVHRGTFVPIDPCQGVIAAIRFAMSEHKSLAWIDVESPSAPAYGMGFPDAYAAQWTSLERYCSALLPSISPPQSEYECRRIDHMARMLQGLRNGHRKVLALCHVGDWPWLRGALSAPVSEGMKPIREEGPWVEDFSSLDRSGTLHPPSNYAIDSRTHVFLHAELPWITGLYEQARAQCDDDTHIAVEGLKELFLAARASYRADLGHRARQITPLLISQCLKYIRNQTLLERRLTPCLYTLARSSQQIMGDTFAIHLVNVAKEYPFDAESPWPVMKMGIDHGSLPDWGIAHLQSRLPGIPVEWKHLELNRPADKKDRRKWASRWNPYQQCSWPEEDTRIESFRNRVMERARGIIGADLARTEKLSTSMMDGLDLRETLRHWYDGSLYVKVLPPSIGHLDATVMLFDPEPDPREYTWRATWYAEHIEESTLSFFATPFSKEMLGPGVAVSTYGGAMFLYPPRPIDDIWTDRNLDFADTLEQRLVAAACLHAESRHIAILSHAVPGYALKSIAKRFRRKLVHVPLGQFSDSVVQQLRMFHVLNGKHVRSYAAHFIRKV